MGVYRVGGRWKVMKVGEKERERKEKERDESVERVSWVWAWMAAAVAEAVAQVRAMYLTTWAQLPPPSKWPKPSRYRATISNEWLLPRCRLRLRCLYFRMSIRGAGIAVVVVTRWCCCSSLPRWLVAGNWADCWPWADSAKWLPAGLQESPGAGSASLRACSDAPPSRLGACSSPTRFRKPCSESAAGKIQKQKRSKIDVKSSLLIKNILSLFPCSIFRRPIAHSINKVGDGNKRKSSHYISHVPNLVSFFLLRLNDGALFSFISSSRPFFSFSSSIFPFPFASLSLYWLPTFKCQ